MQDCVGLYRTACGHRESQESRGGEGGELPIIKHKTNKQTRHLILHKVVIHVYSFLIYH